MDSSYKRFPYFLCSTSRPHPDGEGLVWFLPINSKHVVIIRRHSNSSLQMGDFLGSQERVCGSSIASCEVPLMSLFLDQVLFRRRWLFCRPNKNSMGLGMPQFLRNRFSWDSFGVLPGTSSSHTPPPNDYMKSSSTSPRYSRSVDGNLG